ncbi:MAG: heme biosynthesis protein HemY [Flavobacteriales bacterium]|nr:heme biosynthesis protein HemY [Flavobacteriales bacterium]
MKLSKYILLIIGLFFFQINCTSPPKFEQEILSRKKYKEQLKGFWLGQCIANWTGLVTEMDKIGNIGDIKTGSFYTREDWGKKDLPNIWGEEKGYLSPTIDFVFRDTNEVWGADDDTDIEYIYQHLLCTNKTLFLSPEQIKNGWLKHIKSEEENHLWVSNQKAFDLMQEGILPPETSAPENNEFYDMIDAQLTTEIFGLFAPNQPDLALKMAKLPIQTTARGNAEHIAQFYVAMHSLIAANSFQTNQPKQEHKEVLFNAAQEARKILPDSTYSAKMYDFVYEQYQQGTPWENTRDSLYKRYQVEQMDGYDITSRNMHCNGCFAAGINFGASLISLFYGEGNYKNTIKIGTLAGWDSDNPTATWGGLIGFMLGKEGIEKVFNRKFSNQFNIHRTRQNFEKNGIDNFENMAETGMKILDWVMEYEIKATFDKEIDSWIITKKP